MFMFKKERVFRLMLVLSLLIPLTIGATTCAEVTLEKVEDQIWDIDGCIDSNGDIHLVYCTQNGLMFSDYNDGEMQNTIHLTDEDAEEPSIVYSEEMDT